MSSAKQDEKNECPTCGKVLNTEFGVKQHHVKVHGESLVPTKECEVCGDEFKLRPSAKDKRHTCSYECRSKRRAERGLPAKRRQVEITCANCEKVFSVARSDAKTKRYCSMECYKNDRNGEVLECEWCGDEFYAYDSYADKARFCSQDCYGQWLSETNSGEDSWHWKGGHVDYGPGWDDSKKKTIRKRDGYECQICGTSQSQHLDDHNERLHVHHIIPASDIEDPAVRNSEGNLIALCRSCHMRMNKFEPLLPANVAD